MRKNHYKLLPAEITKDNSEKIWIENPYSRFLQTQSNCWFKMHTWNIGIETWKLECNWIIQLFMGLCNAKTSIAFLDDCDNFINELEDKEIITFLNILVKMKRYEFIISRRLFNGKIILSSMFSSFVKICFL